MSLGRIVETDIKTATDLEDHLLRDLRLASPQGINKPIRLATHDAAGNLIAGLTGSTSYGWLLIKVLWVAPDYRRCGLGRALVTRACQTATDFGCHCAWLETSNPAALAFYRSLGFGIFAKLENTDSQEPAFHLRWFLKMPLMGPDANAIWHPNVIS